MKAANNWIIVKPIPREEYLSKGGIVIPLSGQDPPDRGVVHSVGPAVKNPPSVGSKVGWASYAGIPTKDMDTLDDLLIVMEEDLMELPDEEAQSD